MKRILFYSMFLTICFALVALTGCSPIQGENNGAEGAPVSIYDIIQSLTEDGLADDIPDEQTQNYAPEDADTPNDLAPGEETVPVENLSLYIPVVEDVINADNERVYFYNENVEVDFYVPEDELAIQVSYSIADDNTLNREAGALQKLPNVRPCRRRVIITYDEEHTIADNRGNIEVIPCWKWLLEK